MLTAIIEDGLWTPALLRRSLNGLWTLMLNAITRRTINSASIEANTEWTMDSDAIGVQRTDYGLGLCRGDHCMLPSVHNRINSSFSFK